jgi:hypothetical protein
VIVPSYNPRYSTPSLSKPSDFLTNKIEAPAGDKDEQMNPLAKFSSNQAFKASSSLFANEYIGPTGGMNPSFSGILWSYGLWGRNWFAITSENRGRNS